MLFYLFFSNSLHAVGSGNTQTSLLSYKEKNIMTFFDVLYSLFLHISFNLPTLDLTATQLCLALVVLVGSVLSVIIRLATTWRKVARARKNSNSLWAAVIDCIAKNHGELYGDIWSGYAKIKIEKNSLGLFRAVSHGEVISLPDWQWSE